MPAAVVFDLDGTLCDFAAGARLALAEVAAGPARGENDAHRLRAAFHDQARTFFPSLPADYWTRHTQREALEHLWGRTLAALGLEVAQAPALAARHARLLVERAPLFPDALPALEQVGRRWPLGLISNGPVDAQRPRAEALGLVERFAVLLFEGELGVGKPDPRIFQEAARALDASPAELVMVGDSLGHDVAGAKAAGWRAAWLRREGAGELLMPAAAAAGVRADVVVADLLEFARWLEEGP